jgi:hypothetical protein
VAEVPNRPTLVVVNVYEPTTGEVRRIFADLDVSSSPSGGTVISGVVGSEDAVFALLFRCRDAGLSLAAVSVHR